jgi:calcineurin-like phosphoesterase family protein
LVYILGDIGFTPIKDLSPLIQRLNGRKILITGNHDKGVEGEYRKMGFIDVKDHPVYYSSSIILSHEPVREAFDNPYVYNIHGHLHKSYVDLPNFINANIELYDYKPISLKDLQDEIRKKTKSRREKFGEEWYYQYFKRLS